jgi:hypothetical protein
MINKTEKAFTDILRDAAVLFSPEDAAFITTHAATLERIFNSPARQQTTVNPVDVRETTTEVAAIEKEYADLMKSISINNMKLAALKVKSDARKTMINLIIASVSNPLMKATLTDLANRLPNIP